MALQIIEAVCQWIYNNAHAHKWPTTPTRGKLNKIIIIIVQYLEAQDSTDKDVVSLTLLVNFGTDTL